MTGKNKKSWINYAIIIAAVVALVIASVAWYYDFVIPSEGQIYGSCFGPLSKCNAVVYNNTLYVKFFNIRPKIKNATFYFLPSTSQANGGIADSFNNAIISINTPQGKPLNLSNTKAFTVAFNLLGPPNYFPDNYSYNVNGYVDIIGGYYNNNTKFNETAAIIAKPNVSETGAYGGCPEIPSVPTKELVLLLINETSEENMIGACAFYALSTYNSSDVFQQYNISFNLTKSYQNFINGNPTLSPNSILANETVINFSGTGLMCVKFTPDNNASNNPTAINESAKAYKVHYHKCNPGWEKDSLQINITSPNTTLIIPRLPQYMLSFIANHSNSTAYANSSVSDNWISGKDPIKNATTPNWAGFVAVSNYTNPKAIFTEVNGSWTVQQALPSPRATDSGQWVGIGGFNGNPLLIQTGTASCYDSGTYFCGDIGNGNGGSSYAVWLEELPLPPLPVANINAGDVVHASVTYIGLLFFPGLGLEPSWLINVYDVTSGQATDFVVPYLPPSIFGNTADWVDELPATGLSNPIGNFTNFVNAFYTASYAEANGDTAKYPINSFDVYKLKLVNFHNNNSYYDSADTSNLDPTGTTFSVNNFRMDIISTSNTTTNGINRPTIYVAVYGGTGNYSTDLSLSNNNGNTLNSYSCDPYILSGQTEYKEFICKANVAGLTPGKYSAVIVATDAYVSGEKVYSSPINITINSSTPSSIQSFSLTLTNNQQSTAAPFQQMLVVDSAAYPGIAPSWDNVEFTTGSDATGTALPAWVESNASSSSTHTIVWVKMPNGVPSGTSTIYMDVMPNAVMSASGPTGEAPELSPSYGEYDNGARVFNYYDNFAGSTSGWNSYAYNTSAIANDGLLLTINGNGYFVTNAEYGPGTAFDAYITGPQDTQNIGYIDTSQQTATDLYGNIGWTGAYIRAACGVTYADQVNTTNEANPCGSRYGTLSQSEGITGVYSVIPISSTTSEQSLNYGAYGSVSIGAQNYPMPVGFSIMGLDKGTETISASWALVRTAPPNGVMPSYSLGDPGPDAIASAVITTTTTTSSVTSTVTGTSTSTTSTTITTINP